MKNKNKIRLCKRDLWLSHFLNSSNARTFLNRKESARAAGYKTENEASLEAIGHENFRKLSDRIEAWLQDEGISNNELKIRLIQLMEAKETRFQTMKGTVNPDSLPECVKVLATTGVIERAKNGGVYYGDGISLLAIETENLELQRRALDMALKVKGMYAPTKNELTGKNGEPIATRVVIELVRPEHHFED